MLIADIVRQRAIAASASIRNDPRGLYSVLEPDDSADTTIMDDSHEHRATEVDQVPEHIVEIDDGEKHLAKRVLRKIDWRLIPLMFITYNLNFMDKTILSSASVFGLREDTVSSPNIPLFCSRG